MSDFCGPDPECPSPAGPGAGGAAVFWMLIALGIATFTPCIILPEWRDYQAARAAEMRQRHRVEQLRRLVARERATLDAIQNDPTVVARLARRDLGFRHLKEQEVAVDLGEVDAAASTQAAGDDFEPPAVEPPAWFARATGSLPDLEYDAIFCEPGTRAMVMILSLSLIVVAVVLFHPRAASGVTGRENPT